MTPCHGSKPSWKKAAETSPRSLAVLTGWMDAAVGHTLFCSPCCLSSFQSPTWASGILLQGQLPPRRSWPLLTLWTTSSSTWLRALPPRSSSFALSFARKWCGGRGTNRCSLGPKCEHLPTKSRVHWHIHCSWPTKFDGSVSFRLEKDGPSHPLVA